MPEQQNPLALSAALFLGYKMPGALHLRGHLDPPGSKAYRLQLLFENHPDRLHAGEIFRAVDTVNKIKKAEMVLMALVIFIFFFSTA
jgi:hypothetical protein